MNNIFANVPKNIDHEIFTPLIDNGAIKIERILSKGHTSPATGWYDQDKNEWLIVLRGAAVILFSDGTSINLQTGDYLQIPAHKKHRVQWTDPDVETIWLTVFY